MSLENPVTSPGIDPGTVRLVAQRLNHYAIPGSSTHLSNVTNLMNIVVKSLQHQQMHSSTVMYFTPNYEGWNFNSGNYLFTTDTK